MSEATADRPAPGLVVVQPSKGFRYGAEAFWLAGFALACRPPAARALDLGTGSGIVGLLLARCGLEVLGVDLRPEWRDLWQRTLRQSDVAGRVELRTADVREVEGQFDLVVSNPPFFPVGTGPVATDPWRAAARTESTATLADFVEAALRCLGDGGRACFVVPRDREADLIAPTHAAGGRITELVRVGRRRTLVALAAGRGADATPQATTEDGPVCAAWYAAVAGSHGPPYQQR